MKNGLSGGKIRRGYALFLATALVCAALGGLTGMAIAEEKTTYAAIYSSDNPIPEIAKNVRPAVVQVINKVITWSQQTGEVAVEQGFGSGVYIDERGYLITNNHVVEGADALEILLLDGTRLSAELIGVDGGTDLAVLKADMPKGVAPVPLGDSDALEIGELAIAIGNPGDAASVLFGTVTAGIISALDREDVNANNFSRSVKVIQTDTAINTGNSGGALLNAKGELIGIPTLKIMADARAIYEGLGFAIPINTAKPIVEQLIASGKIVRPRLGVTVTNLDGPESPLRNYPPAGVQVMEVEMGSPAMRAGLLNYDIIMEIDGVRIKNYNLLTGRIDQLQAGDTVELTVCRFFNPTTAEPLPEYQMLTLTVTLENLD